LKETLRGCRARLTILWACAAFLVAYPPRLSAATITVTTLDDSGPGSLRQAIADAMRGDTIDCDVTRTGSRVQAVDMGAANQPQRIQSERPVGGHAQAD